MSSFAFWERLKGKNSSEDEEVSGFDFYYHLIYMAAIAGAGISRSRLFQLASQLPSASSRYFQMVYTTVQGLTYTYPEACSLVGESARSEQVKSFLLRFSNTLSSGEPEAEFLPKEAQVQEENYANEYERDVESLRKWTDAYAALLISVTLIIVINLVSTLIYDIGSGLMIAMIAIAILIGFGGAWVLWRAAPKEVRNVPLAQGSREQRLSLRLCRILVPAAVILCLLLLLLGVKLGLVLILSSLLLLPLGIVSIIADKRIVKKDEEIGPFLRSLGGMATSTATTLSNALIRVDLDPFPSLKQDIARLRYRIQALIDPNLAWRRFMAETGSKLISQSTGIFLDAVNLGADPGTVGFYCSRFANRIYMLRAHRTVVSSTFVWLTMVMHAAAVALLVFIIEVISKFLSLIQTVKMPEQSLQTSQMLVLPIPLLTYNNLQIQFLYQLTTLTILLLTGANALALIAVDGGHILKVSYYLCLLLFIAGTCLLLVPPIVSLILRV